MYTFLKFYIYYKFKVLQYLPNIVHNKVLIPLQITYYKKRKFSGFILVLGMILHFFHTALSELLGLNYNLSRSNFPKIQYPTFSTIQGFYVRPFKLKHWHLKLELTVLFYSIIYYIWIKQN